MDLVEIWAWQITLLDLFIVTAMIAGLRKLSGVVANVNTTDELAERDNFAFGISLGGGTIALACMLMGVVSGEAANSLAREAIQMVSFGVVGLILIKVGRLIQDKLVLRGIEIQNQIKQGNIAAAFTDVANVVAIGLIVRAVMRWVEGDQVLMLTSVLAAFVFAQVVLSAVSYFRVFIYKKRHDGGCIQDALTAGNVALSIRYLGHLVGAGLAITASSGLVLFQVEALPISLCLWGAVSVIFTITVSLLSYVSRKVILAGINVTEEVDGQQNIGIAAIEAAIFIANGLLLVALFD